MKNEARKFKFVLRHPNWSLCEGTRHPLILEFDMPIAYLHTTYNTREHAYIFVLNCLIHHLCGE
jgi:hypothetical protein